MNPHSHLGAHEVPAGTVIRALRPHAERVAARIGGVDYPLQPTSAGIFEATVPFHDLMDYRLAVTYPGGAETVIADGYRFLPTIGDVDLHLFNEGRHERLWEILGAHLHTYTTPDGEVSGTSFAVWAPNARKVTVVGEFDHWGGETYPMRMLGSSGVWELFIPGIGVGAKYKYRLEYGSGEVSDRADPMAFQTEGPPATASVVSESPHAWGDGAWLEQRASYHATTAPMAIYEVHLGSWRPGLNYREMGVQLADYVQQQGFTHVELLPVAEHPFGGSWGYQVTSYYAPTARFGTPADFKWFVDHLHQRGIGVILDWVPAHFPKDSFALGNFDGTHLYEHGDPLRRDQADWGTYVFDFGRSEVRNFLVANALFWFDQFHLDGLRVDAVASMLYLDYSRTEWRPNKYGGRENLEAVQFLQEMNATVHKLHPGVVTIAEESTSWPGVTRSTNVGGLGFTMKWNMGWMHDTLGYLGRDPIHRSFHHHEITFSLMYAWSENFVLPLSHDEVVHGKGTLWTRMPGNHAAGVRALLSYMWGHPGKKLLFMGQDYGQVSEWSEERGLDWDQADPGISRMVADLNAVYRAHPAMWSRDTSPGGFSWIDANDSGNNVLSFLRYGSDGSIIACIFNFSGLTFGGYRVGLPEAGVWREIFNSDAGEYGGSGVGNYGAVTATDATWHGRPASAEITIAANSAIWLLAP
ncbi:1,4-alpha-glucan branching protein GlgB [Smaragdicoccus niigatensis]|uniref:1,4-alpha-glucan branching protein GlgB n=1 Tax=Smaragdicoccus niigatensis TaxID=359359 RepID=UPI00035ED42D|nr:1,4-alpha-glucan branching protein GlgB [Smaragdicoccus niigatensis]